MGLVNISGGQPYIFEITTTRTTPKFADTLQPYQYAIQTIKCYTSIDPKQLVAEVSRIALAYGVDAVWTDFTATRSAIVGASEPEGVVNGARGSIYINGSTGIPYIKLSGQVYSTDRENWKGFGTISTYTTIAESKTLESTDFDNSKMICITGADVVLTIPLTMSALPIGTMMTFYNDSTADFSIAGVSGVTIQSESGMLKVKPYGEVKIRKIARNIWRLNGDLTT